MCASSLLAASSAASAAAAAAPSLERHARPRCLVFRSARLVCVWWVVSLRTRGPVKATKKHDEECVLANHRRARARSSSTRSTAAELLRLCRAPGIVAPYAALRAHALRLLLHVSLTRACSVRHLPVYHSIYLRTKYPIPAMR